MNTYLKTRRELINDEKPRAKPFVIAAVKNVLFNEELNTAANTVRNEKLTIPESIKRFGISKYKAVLISAAVNSGMDLSMAKRASEAPVKEQKLIAPKLYYSISMLPAQGMTQDQLDMAAKVVTQVLRIYNKDSGNIQLPLMANEQFEVREGR